jgi:predicted RNA-binding protein YlxR (DUF448 family)
MAARCAWCGKLIYFGDLVTLEPPSVLFKVPDYAIEDESESDLFVGCVHCPEDKNHYRGIWVHPGKVQKFPTIITQRVIHHYFRAEVDPSDPNDLGHLVESETEPTPLEK